MVSYFLSMYISSSIFLTTDLIVKQHQTEKKRIQT